LKGLGQKVGVWVEHYFKVTKVFALCSGVVLLVMMFYVGVDALGRYFADRPLPATFEVTATLMVLIGYLTLAYTQASGRHLRIEFISRRFNPRWQVILEIVGLLLALIFFVLITWQGGDYAVEAWQKKEFMTGLYMIPCFPPRLILTTGAFLLSIQFAIDLVRRTSQLLSISRGRRQSNES